MSDEPMSEKAPADFKQETGKKESNVGGSGGGRVPRGERHRGNKKARESKEEGSSSSGSGSGGAGGKKKARKDSGKKSGGGGGGGGGGEKSTKDAQMTKVGDPVN